MNYVLKVLLILPISLLVMFACERELSQTTADLEQTNTRAHFSALEIEAATDLVLRSHHLAYNLQGLEHKDFENFVDPVTKTIQLANITEVLGKTRYATATDLVGNIITYYNLKAALQEHLANSDKAAFSEELFYFAGLAYAEQYPDLKTEEECLADRASCIANAVANATNASYNCSGFQAAQLRQCLASSNPYNCNGNGFAILSFGQCELSVFQNFQNDYNACQGVFDDCIEECCSSEPPLPNGGVVPWVENPGSVGGGGGGSTACGDTDCSSCTGLAFFSCASNCQGC